MPIFQSIPNKVWTTLVHSVGILSVTWLMCEVVRRQHCALASLDLSQQQPRRNNAGGDDDGAGRGIEDGVNRFTHRLAVITAHGILWLLRHRPVERITATSTGDASTDSDPTDSPSSETSSTAADQGDGEQSTSSMDAEANKASVNQHQDELEHNGPYYPHQSEFVSKHFPTPDHFRKSRK